MTKIKIYYGHQRGCTDHKYNLLVLPASEDDTDITNKYNVSDTPFDEHDFISEKPRNDLIFDDNLKQQLLDCVNVDDDPDEDKAFHVYNLIREQIKEHRAVSKYTTDIQRLISQGYDHRKLYGENPRYLSWNFALNSDIAPGTTVYVVKYQNHDNDGCGCMAFDCPIAVYTDKNKADNTLSKCKNVEYGYNLDLPNGTTFSVESFVFPSENFK